MGLQVQQRPDMQQSGQKEALHPSYREAPLLTILYLMMESHPGNQGSRLGHFEDLL